MASNASSLGFGATSKWNTPVGFQRKNQGAPKAALTIGEFLKQSCDNMAIGVGPRSHEDCPHRVTTECYSPDDSASLNEVIAAAYRQVFGNAHVMDFERSVELEAELRDGRLTVREFIKGLAKSSFYKSRFFSSVAPQRGIELNYKHLLGRAPETQAEISAKIALLSEHGHDTVIDSIVDSAEYLEVFGSDIVPYARSWSSPADLSTAAFPMLAALQKSFAGSDSARGGSPALTRSLASGLAPRISVPSQAVGVIPSKTFAKGRFDSKQPGITSGKDSAPMRGDSYVTFGLGQREQETFQRCPGDTSDQLNTLIRATYKQVMGNPHLMEFERALSAESKFIDGYLSTRELVRAIGLSAEYKKRFFETNAPYRFIELNFKHFLGRAPQSQAEISAHTQILAEGGYEAEIASYVDSEEYQSVFGEDTVPYARILSESGRSQVAFNRHLSLAEGFAASDTVLSSSSLVRSVATGTVPKGWSSTTTRINRTGTQSGAPDPTKKRFRIVVANQTRMSRQRTSGSTYLVSGKDMSSQIKYIHARGGKIVSITEVM
ncbi:rod linker polypeptide (Lr)/ C-phycoerythrin I and II-associated [Synechococcus sp. A18-25c]|uniref:phycobilisome rod-core linker polypeptide n=1 Tax=Synechococcus sp. A18-25c TaxID=1866938 RepID=UPI0016477D7E|nr:phycobilisome rod-core linker polypeptide [Synechococcus sp. A18-25c]QNJ18848.1 rod linker polypeptide (Lr)/ C-phycoerythrin I and II-associated [Synechococcus sp. A18-25c]